MTDEWLMNQYAGSADPWGFAERWYERRKYALTLAALPRRRYRSAFEPGCSIGVLTAGLAERCDRILACDLVPAAVDRARARLAGRSHVEVMVWDARDAWPGTGFDLIVVSELLYYLTETETAHFCARMTRHLAADGHVVAVHWRRSAVPHVLPGDRVDALVRGTGLPVLGEWRDADFVLSVLGREPRSVAECEGLA